MGLLLTLLFLVNIGWGKKKKGYGQCGCCLWLQRCRQPKQVRCRYLCRDRGGLLLSLRSVRWAQQEATQPHPQRCNKSHTWGMSKGHVEVRACRISAGGHARQCLCFGFAAAQCKQAQKGGRAQAWGQAAIFCSRWQPAFLPQPRPPSNHVFCTHPRGLGLAARVTRRRARHVRYFGCLECV